MVDSDKSDFLIIKTHNEGAEAELTRGDQRMVEIDPAGVTITRGLRNQIPDPADADAQALLAKIFAAHKESDGLTLVNLATEFRTKFGWSPRVEWLRVLGLETVRAASLIAEQQRLIQELEAGKAGTPPADAVPLVAPIAAETWDWALGANYLNLMEWLWKEARYDDAHAMFEKSLVGLSESDDNGRRIERSLFKASCEAHLNRTTEALGTMERAYALDVQEFERLWRLYGLRMPELAPLVERVKEESK